MTIKTLTLATVAALGLAACSQDAGDATATDDAAMADQATNTDTTGTIVEEARENPDFSTLVTAIQAAGLGETLSGGGPYTVFAPDNAAFAKLPEGTLANLTTNDKDTLGEILKYHVVDGETMAATLIEAIGGAGEEGYTITTLGGSTLTARSEGGKVTLTDKAGNTATVTATDVAASNGVIHVIDTVLIPE